MCARPGGQASWRVTDVGDLTKPAVATGIMGAMTGDDTNGYRSGDTALIVAVPEVEPLVGRWRRQFDPAAAAGVPAHVTILAPFLDGRRIDAGVISALRALIASQGAFAIRFARCGRFPGVLYLAPAPAEPLAALTEAIAAAWPEAPPYGGQFPEVIPHLTVAHGQDEGTVDAIEPELAAGLPILASVETVHLIEYTAHQWREREAFSLGRPAG
jgi:2'-5' RNA ligase